MIFIKQNGHDMMRSVCLECDLFVQGSAATEAMQTNVGNTSVLVLLISHLGFFACLFHKHATFALLSFFTVLFYLLFDVCLLINCENVG